MMKVFFVLIFASYQIYPSSTQPNGTTKLCSLQVENLRKEFLMILDNQEQKIAKLKDDLYKLTDEGIHMTGSGTAMNVSKIYTRWGKTTCPDHADTVYSGFVGGSPYSHRGGAAEPLCMPKDPEWGIYTNGSKGDVAYLHGTKYGFETLKDSRGKLTDNKVPCAVCKVNKRSTIMMLPARKNCYGGWNKEYQGYLMAGFWSHNRASKFICLDEIPDTVPYGKSYQESYVLNSVKGICGSLNCPPYVEGRELTCVVCSQ